MRNRDPILLRTDKPEKARDLVAAQCCAAVALDGNGFEHSTLEIAPCRLEDRGDVIRKFDGNLHGNRRAVYRCSCSGGIRD